MKQFKIQDPHACVNSRVILPLIYLPRCDPQDNTRIRAGCSIRKGNSGRIAQDIEFAVVVLTETKQRQTQCILPNEAELLDIPEPPLGIPSLLQEEQAPVGTDPVYKVLGEVAEDVTALKLGDPAPTIHESPDNRVAFIMGIVLGYGGDRGKVAAQSARIVRGCGA
jgi:hypothetical protein